MISQTLSRYMVILGKDKNLIIFKVMPHHPLFLFLDCLTVIALFFLVARGIRSADPHPQYCVSRLIPQSLQCYSPVTYQWSQVRVRNQSHLYKSMSTESYTKSKLTVQLMLMTSCGTVRHKIKTTLWVLGKQDVYEM